MATAYEWAKWKRAMDAGSAVIATVAAWCAGSGPAAGGMDASREKMERYSFECEKKEANCCISPVPPFSPCFHPLDPYVSNATHGALLLHCKSFALRRPGTNFPKQHFYETKLSPKNA